MNWRSQLLRSYEPKASEPKIKSKLFQTEMLIASQSVKDPCSFDLLKGVKTARGIATQIQSLEVIIMTTRWRFGATLRAICIILYTTCSSVAHKNNLVFSILSNSIQVSAIFKVSALAPCGSLTTFYTAKQPKRKT
ncbi:hypothetical protein CDAR_79441 [Caerostris darwini]|uniref:Uncharacterized protein n=1 Tax=Caerostris darwini TaxID=1538125 RepID=A0AAV4RJX8_9ARAC|nr:hypothetical protein CDAR_79441 [Caerostris darwini]